jgi:anaerobic magnesium-protoporphyrin IX monomethyl ester cyclase
MNHITPIAEQTPKKSARLVRDTDDRRLADVYEMFAAPAGATGKVTLVRPFSVLSKSTYSAAILPPLGLAYLASVLRCSGYDVGIVDAQGADIFNIRHSECGRYYLQGLGIAELVDAIDPETTVVGVSLMFSQEWLPQRDFIQAVRARYPNMTIVVGGEHPTAFPEYVLRDCPEIDYVISGEAEITLLELVHRIFHAKDTVDSPGVACIDENGALVTNGFSDRITHIDDLPRPAWDICELENYFQPNWAMGIGMGRHMPILATRGCPYQCTFCSNPLMWTTRYKMRDPKEVVDEIEYLVREYKADSIDFFDLTAIVKKEWTLAFCAELKRRNLSITWQLPSGTRSEALDQETLTAIYETGCRLITYAPESGSERTLKSIKKMLKLPRIIDSIRIAKRIGHTVKANLVIGFPDEEHRDILKTLWLSFKLALYGTDDCNISIFSPYPGSELYERLRGENKIPAPDDDYIISLLVYFDLTKTASYCEGVSGRSLAFYRLIVYLVFYSTAYVVYPKRLIRVAKSIMSASFKPGNVIEQRLYDIYARRTRSRSA